MSIDTPAVVNYHETYDAPEEGDVSITVTGADAVIVRARTTGRDSLAIEEISVKERNLLTRASFAPLRHAIADLERRGWDVDLGPLSGLGMADSVAERFDAAARERAQAVVPEAGPVPEASSDGGTTVSATQSDLVEDVMEKATQTADTAPTPAPREMADGLQSAIRPLAEGERVGVAFNDDGTRKREHRTWCGICGRGPFQSLSHHHRHLHEGEPQPRSEPPTPMEIHDWLDADPREVVADATPNRDLAEVCDAVAKYRTNPLQMKKRLGQSTVAETDRMLVDLGLKPERGADLYKEETLQARLDALRRWADE